MQKSQRQVNRIVEAYVGEYASGKSEVALNRALDLVRQGRKMVTLVDFDLVEPFYTLRSLKKGLEEQGLRVLTWLPEEIFGFGEAGMVLKPEIRWVLKRDGDVILDVGYGVAGLQKLQLLEGFADEVDLEVFVVLNIARPLTAEINQIVAYIRSLGPVQGLINNSHCGDDTDIALIQEGARIVTRSAQILGVPVKGTTVRQELAEKMGGCDAWGNPIFFLKRQMNRYPW